MAAEFWAGYISGAAGIIIGNPLDVLKVRLQATSRPSTLYPSSPTSPLSTSPRSSPSTNLSIFRDLSILVRGLPAPVITYGALNALLFWSYTQTLHALPSSPPPSSWRGDSQSDELYYAPWTHFTAGAVAGLVTFCVSAPTELIKCRAQVAGSSPSSAPGSSATSSWTIARDVWRKHGIRGIYRGGVVTSLRDSIGYGFYYLSYALSTTAWEQAYDARTGSERRWYQGEQMKILMCGGLAGVITWLSIYPLDVVKSRLQTQQVLMNSSTKAISSEQTTLLADRSQARSLSAWEIARSTYRTEGIRAFFRGVTVCSCRAFIVNAVQWATYEYARKAFNG